MGNSNTHIHSRAHTHIDRQKKKEKDRAKPSVTCPNRLSFTNGLANFALRTTRAALVVKGIAHTKEIIGKSRGWRIGSGERRSRSKTETRIHCRCCGRSAAKLKDGADRRWLRSGGRVGGRTSEIETRCRAEGGGWGGGRRPK